METINNNESTGQSSPVKESVQAAFDRLTGKSKVEGMFRGGVTLRPREMPGKLIVPSDISTEGLAEYTETYQDLSENDISNLREVLFGHLAVESLLTELDTTMRFVDEAEYRDYLTELKNEIPAIIVSIAQGAVNIENEEIRSELSEMTKGMKQSFEEMSEVDDEHDDDEY